MDSFEVNIDENDNESIAVDVHENVILEDEPIESKMLFMKDYVGGDNKNAMLEILF